MRLLATKGAQQPLIHNIVRGLSVYDIDAWIREHFRYRPEHEEVLRTVPHMLGQLVSDGYFEGDCDDVSIFFAACVKAKGNIPVRFVAIRTQRGNPAFLHVFTEVKAYEWRRFDATVQPGLIHIEHARMTEYV